MADLSQMSDAELMSIAGIGNGSVPDVGSMSDSDLYMAAGIQPSIEMIANEQAGTKENAASGYLSGFSSLGDMASMLFDPGAGMRDQMVMDAAKNKYKEWAAANGLDPRALDTPEGEAFVRERLPRGSLSISAGDALRSGIDLATGIENSTQINPDSYAHSIAEALPSTFGLSPLALTSSIGSGIGDQAARDLGVNPIIGSIIGGSTPSALKALTSPITRLLTPGGQKITAANELLGNAGPEGATRIKALLEADSPPVLAGGPKTYAEIADTPSAASFQKAIRMIPGEGQNIIENALVGTELTPGRDLKLRDLLKEVAPGSMEQVTPDIRGNLIRSAGKEIVESADQEVKSAWDSLGNSNVKISIKDIPNQAKALQSKLETPLGYSSGASKVVNALFDSKGNPKQNLTVTDYQKIRSAAGEVLSDASNSGRNREAALMAGIRDMLDKSAEKVANTQYKTRGDISKLYEAIEITKKQKETFGTGAIKDIFQKGDGGYRLRESAIPTKIISTPEASKQFAKAFGDNPEVMGQVKGALIDDMTSTKDPTSWIKNFGKKEAQFKAIFGDDINKVKAVLEDIGSSAKVEEMATRASKRQSFTTQGLTVAKKLLTEGPRTLSKLLASQTGKGVAAAGGFSVAGLPGVVAGWGASKIAKWSEDAIQRSIAQAMVDPDFLKSIVQKADANGMAKALDRVLPGLALRIGSLASVSGSRPTAETQQKLESQLLNSFQSSSNYTSDPSTRASFKDDLIDRTLDIAEGKIMEGKTPEIIEEKKIEQELPKNIFDLPLEQVMKIPVPEEAEKKFTKLVKAVIKQESGGNAKAVSKKGAQGLMQIMPATAKDIAKEMGLKNYDIYDPETNKQMGEYYLKKMLNAFNGDVKLALAAYNWGIGNVKKAIKKHGNSWEAIKDKTPLETRGYVRKITKNFMV